jgi:hypothetical protein
VSPTRKRATSALFWLSRGEGCPVKTRGFGGEETSGSLFVGKLLQPVKMTQAATSPDMNNPLKNNFIGSNPCESADAINIFV